MGFTAWYDVCLNIWNSDLLPSHTSGYISLVLGRPSCNNSRLVCSSKTFRPSLGVSFQCLEHPTQPPHFPHRFWIAGCHTGPGNWRAWQFVFQYILWPFRKPWTGKNKKMTWWHVPFCQNGFTVGGDSKVKVKERCWYLAVCHLFIQPLVWQFSSQARLTNIFLWISAACQHPSRFICSKWILQLNLEYRSIFWVKLKHVQNRNGTCPT